MSYFKLSFLFAIFLFSQNLQSSEKSERITITYLKAGSELGIGYRQHTRQHGFDLSLNEAVCSYPNWINVKALYMHYPLYASRRFFYWGLGGGINDEFYYHSKTPLLGGIIRGCSHCSYYRIFFSVEGLVGYEFFIDQKIRLFVQGGVSVPLDEASFPLFPSLAIGIGF